jgi:hypothetical protein
MPIALIAHGDHRIVKSWQSIGFTSITTNEALVIACDLQF